MAIPYEKAVAEDLNLGHGTVSVTMPGGGTATGNKIGIHSLLETVFNVKDFGAVGDGETDDTDALEACKSACSAAGGGIIFLPEGTYCFNFTNSSPTFGWYFNFAVQLCGVGPTKSILKNMSTTAAGLRFSGATQLVRDLTIDNNNSSGNAFQHGGQYSSTENVEIKNQAGAGYAYVLSGCTLSLIKDVHLNTVTNGFRSDTTPTQYITFDHCSVESSSGVALSIASGANLRFLGLYLEDDEAAGNMGRFISLDACENVDFFSMACEIGTRTLTDAEYFKVNNCKSINFWGGRINHATTASKSFFKVTGTTSRNVCWDGIEIVSTQASMVLFDVDASATLYGIAARNIYTNLTSAATGLKHTSAVIQSSIENWVDNNAACAHTLSGSSHLVVNVEGAIATTWVSPGNLAFINCSGALSGTGATRAFRFNSGPSGSVFAISASATDIPVFADNAAALAGGLAAGQVYRTAAGALMVTN
jgi:hypothetical protein